MDHKELEQQKCVGVLLSFLGKRSLIHELDHHKDQITAIEKSESRELFEKKPSRELMKIEEAIEEIKTGMSYLDAEIMDKCQCICEKKRSN